MQITGGSALSKDEIDRMMRDAEAHAEEDRKRRDEVEARNTAETLLYSTEKFIKDNDDKLPAEPKAEAEAALDELRTALEGTDTDAITAAAEKAATASQALGAAMYAQSATAEGGAANGDGAAPDDDESVVDAEIVDEGDER